MSDADQGPDLPEVEMNLLTPKNPGVGVVVESYTCTGRKPAGFVRHVSIDVSGTPLAGRFRSGQSFGVIAPGEDAKGKPHKVRLYSISSPSAGDDGAGKVVATTVKRVIDEHWEDHSLFLGVASNYLCDLKPGDKVKVTGPNGRRFLLPSRPEEHDYLFFAAGTGIAPFRSMMLDLMAQGVGSRITLIMGSPYSTDLMYDDEFRAMEEEHPNVRYLTAISREQQSDGNGKLYVQDRLETNKDELVPMLCNERTLVYVCGLTGMEVGIFRHMQKLLPAEWLARYVSVREGELSDIGSWDSGEIKKKVRPTKRMFLEVY